MAECGGSAGRIPAAATTTCKAGCPCQPLCQCGSGRVRDPGLERVAFRHLLKNGLKRALSQGLSRTRCFLKHLRNKMSGLRPVQTLDTAGKRIGRSVIWDAEPAPRSLLRKVRRPKAEQIPESSGKPWVSRADRGASRSSRRRSRTAQASPTMFRLFRSCSITALATPPSLTWGGGREVGGVSVSASKGSISEGIPLTRRTQPQPKQ